MGSWEVDRKSLSSRKYETGSKIQDTRAAAPLIYFPPPIARHTSNVVSYGLPASCNNDMPSDIPVPSSRTFDQHGGSRSDIYQFKYVMHPSISYE